MGKNWELSSANEWNEVDHLSARELEDHWYEKVRDALADCNRASQQRRMAASAYRSGETPSPDGWSAISEALAAERRARQEYARAQAVLEEVMVWKRKREAGAGYGIRTRVNQLGRLTPDH